MEVMAARPSISINNSVGSGLPYVSLPLFIQTNNNTQQEEEQQQESMHPSIANHEDHEEEEEKEEVSSESSIGQPDQSSSEDEQQLEDEVQSKLFNKPLIMSLNSIQEALPIKRGLSNYYSGKSKSFACISDVMNGKAGDLVKHENPFNKRRRILMATSRRASYNSLIQAHNDNYSSSFSSLPPLMISSSFTLEEEKEDDHNDKQPTLEGSSTSSSSSSLAPLSILDHTRAFNKSFKSPRSFSLSDLQHA